jgi:GNAT superfamily N-acetyltransferase
LGSSYVATPTVPAFANTYAPSMADLRVEPITGEHYEALLPMISAYQGFYEAEDIRDDRNREFFRRFLSPSDEGMLIGAWSGDSLVGYACLYWHFSSLEACESVLMNDLFVDESARGQGVGRALIGAAVAVAREREVPFVEWSTAPDNETAQRLYDSTGAERTEWFSYELRV